MATSQISFETPENIEVGYDLAGLGSRFAAWVLDQMLVTFIVLVLFIAILIAGLISESILDDLVGQDPAVGADTPAYVIGIFYLLYSIGSFFYFGLFELFNRGQTIGKKKLGIRVVQVDGFNLRATSILLRSVFRVVDQLPPLWIVPFVTKRQSRMGDMVAGTVVVSDRPNEMSNVRRSALEHPISENTFRFGSAISKLTEADVDVIERFIDRMPSMSGEQKQSLMKSLVTPLAERFGMPVPEHESRELFLRELLAAHYHREYRRLG